MIDKVAFEKLAQVRNAEVRGTLAAFVDAGLMKVASAEEFDILSDVVAENVGFDYDMQKIAAVTDAILDEIAKQSK